MRSRVMIESPFASSTTHTESEHRVYLHSCMLNSLRRGEAPFASHGLYPYCLDDRHPEERMLGIECGFVWGLQAELIAFYTDLGWSRGMLAAKNYYENAGIPIEERRI